MGFWGFGVLISINMGRRIWRCMRQPMRGPARCTSPDASQEVNGEDLRGPRLPGPIRLLPAAATATPHRFHGLAHRSGSAHAKQAPPRTQTVPTHAIGLQRGENKNGLPGGIRTRAAGRENRRFFFFFVFIVYFFVFLILM